MKQGCKRLPVNATGEDVAAAHKAKMAAKKHALQTGAVRVGFRAVHNKRIDDAITAQTILIAMDAQARRLNLTPAEIHRRAVESVARTLPARPMVRSYRPRPSRSSDAAYRKSIWPVAKTAGAAVAR